VIKDGHIPGNRGPIGKLPRLAVKGMGNLEIEPDRGGAREDNLVAFTCQILGFTDICRKVRKSGCVCF